MNEWMYDCMGDFHTFIQSYIQTSPARTIALSLRLSVSLSLSPTLIPSYYRAIVLSLRLFVSPSFFLFLETNHSLFNNPGFFYKTHEFVGPFDYFFADITFFNTFFRSIVKVLWKSFYVFPFAMRYVIMSVYGIVFELTLPMVTVAIFYFQGEADIHKSLIYQQNTDFVYFFNNDFINYFGKIGFNKIFEMPGLNHFSIRVEDF